MGSNNTREQKENKKKLEITNEDELNFYTDVVDPNLGAVKIYTCKKYHLCYILKYEKSEEDTKIYNIFKKVELSQLTPLLSLYGFNIERKTCCNRICNQKISSYWQYYNFYFNDYLARRRQQNLMFIDSEIWHIVEICCETYQLFRKFGVYYQINPQTFVITPEGKLKAFWCHLKSQNAHIKFFQFFDSNFKVYRFAYSPEELLHMHQQERATKIDFDKCNSYRLGILLLECLSLIDPLSNCYNPSMTSINASAIRSLIITKVIPNYPTDIVNLLRCLLREDPKKRPTLNQIYEEYFSRFSPDFELRVCGVRVADSVQSRHDNVNNNQNANENDDFLELMNMKKGSELSDEKTVKFRPSVRRN